MQTKENQVTQFAQQVLEQVRQVIVGKDQQLSWVFAAILAGGHILIEDIPGVGKTTMAVAFSRSLGLACNRVQFTPDVLPSDVTGYSILDQSTGKMTYQPGAVLCNLFLADELNRATSRTQSALLEAMEEGQVTVDGNRYELPKPFVVIATQNPTGAAGTQLLPDSQMDRFLIRMSLGYPDKADEVAMVLSRQGKKPLELLHQVCDTSTLVALQEEIHRTYVSEPVVQYVVELINATRNHGQVLRGASPRATLAVTSLAKAMAQLQGRDYVLPRDVQEVFVKVVEHRLLLNPRAEAAGVTSAQVLTGILRTVPAPKTH